MNLPGFKAETTLDQTQSTYKTAGAAFLSAGLELIPQLEPVIPQGLLSDWCGDNEFCQDFILDILTSDWVQPIVRNGGSRNDLECVRCRAKCYRGKPSLLKDCIANCDDIVC